MRQSTAVMKECPPHYAFPCFGLVKYPKSRLIRLLNGVVFSTDRDINVAEITLHFSGSHVGMYHNDIVTAEVGSRIETLKASIRNPRPSPQIFLFDAYLEEDFRK